MAALENRLKDLDRKIQACDAKVDSCNAKSDETHKELVRTVEQIKVINRELFEVVKKIQGDVADLTSRADQTEEALDILADMRVTSDDEYETEGSRSRSRGRSQSRKQVASKPTRGTSPNMDPTLSPKSRRNRDRLMRYRDLSPDTRRRELDLEDE